MVDKVTLMSPEDFLMEFVPKADTSLPDNLIGLLSSVPKVTIEKKMYEPLMTALNDSTAGLCPGFKFVATPSKSDPASDIKQAVDCGMYPSEFAPSPGVDDTGKTTSPPVDWSRIQVSIEVKPTMGEDPFVDTNPDGVPTTATRKAVFGQVLAYAKSVFDHQHLKFHFMVIIVEETARLVRVDRSGMFITTSFNFKTHGQPLLEFFWRYARLSAEQRGEDPTAERILPTSDEARSIRRRLRNAPDDYVRALFKKSLDTDWPWWILTVQDERTNTARRFFVGKPHFESPGVAGRGTRGYVALDFVDESAPFVYLKDCWRVVHDEIKKEGAVLETLNAKDVPYVPTLECHGDLGQRTVSEELWRKYHPDADEAVRCPLKSHEHYRLVVKEVGRPLEEFHDGEELVFALFCILKAHWVAYELGILHRDISAGNILLYPHNGKMSGMLNDWELSKEVQSEEPVGRQPDRTGTWQFLSARALNDGEKLIVIQDELESVFHVLVYMAIRFFSHNCRDNAVGRLLYEYFDDYQDSNRGYACGPMKRTTMDTGKISFVQDGVQLVLKFTQPAEPKQPKDAQPMASEGSAAQAQEDPESPAVSPPVASATKPQVPHPINKLLAKLLCWFKAYYAVTQAKEDPPLLEESDPAPSPPRVSKYEDDLTLDLPFAAKKKSEPIVLKDEEDEETVAVTTDADEENAKMLQTHQPMLQLFQRFLKKSKWCSEDKCEDKRPKKGYRPGDDVPREPTAFMTLPQPSKRDAEDVAELEPPSTPKRRRAADDDE